MGSDLLKEIRIKTADKSRFPRVMTRLMLDLEAVGVVFKAVGWDENSGGRRSYSTSTKVY